MPTISVPRTILGCFEKQYSVEEFDSLLFDFGLEVDEITETHIKIEVPANRYDLLCTNGLVQSLQAYLGIKDYVDLDVKQSDLQVISTNESRPFIACAVIRNFVFDDDAYDQFIEYQERVHQSIGRNRTLVSMGTHDFDKIEFPALYTELVPSEISFKPLNSDDVLRGDEIRVFFRDSPLLKYCDLLGERFPVLMSNNEVLSLPPVVNSAFSKITKQTRNIFVEVTGTDFNRVNTALKMMLYNFRGEDVLSVSVNYQTTPVFNNFTCNFSLREINAALGLDLTSDEVATRLTRMMHAPSLLSNDSIAVKVVDARSDVLHKVDILEDIAVAHGFNNFKRAFPPTRGIGRLLPESDFATKLRAECVSLGYLEMMCLALEQRSADAQLRISSPKSVECQSLRQSLVPGLLRSISANQHASLPIKIFELGDVVEISTNKRRLCCASAAKVARIEEIQGSLTQLLRKCGVAVAYEESDDAAFYKGRAGVAVADGVALARFGIVSGALCAAHKVPFATTALEINVDALFDAFRKASF